MENIFVIEFAVDAEKKGIAIRVGCDKENFNEEHLKLIEIAIKDVGQMVAMAYKAKLEEKKEDA